MSAAGKPEKWVLSERVPGANGGGEWFHVDVVDGHGWFAQVVWRMEDDERSPDCERRAHVLVAAPDLLAVAQGFRQKLATYVHTYPGDKELRRLLVECDAAIAKATSPAPAPLNPAAFAEAQKFGAGLDDSSLEQPSEVL